MKETEFEEDWPEAEGGFFDRPELLRSLKKVTSKPSHQQS